MCFAENAIVVSDGIGVYVWDLPELKLRTSVVQGSLAPESAPVKKRIVGIDAEGSRVYLHSLPLEVGELSQESIDIILVAKQMNQQLVFPKKGNSGGAPGAASADETANANRFQQVALSGDGRLLATVEEANHRLMIWDVSSGDQVSASDLATVPAATVITGLQFSPDGTTLAVHDSASIWIFSCPSLLLHHRIDVLADRLLPPVVYSADSSKLFVSESVGGPCVTCWSAVTCSCCRVPGTST